MLHILLAFVLVGMVMGEGCCPPIAWEGFVGTMVGSTQDAVPHLTMSFLKYHTNSTLGMIYMEGDAIIDRGQTQQIRILIDNNKLIRYFIMNGKCTKETLARKVLNCIPETATLVLNTYVGAGPETLAVKIYRFIVEDVEVYSTVTSSGCTPVDYVITGFHPVTKAEFMEVAHVSGITAGVKNPSVFDIPSICHLADISSDYVPIMSRWMSSSFY